MRTDKVETLNRIISILDCFTQEHPSLGVRETARQVNLSSSATGRLMAAMKDLGILSQNHSTREYALGARVLTWAGVYAATLDVRNVALPAIEELHNTTRETISLYVLEGNERVCVERMESPENVRIVARIGRRLPLYAGSAGKVFLAFMPSQRRDAILDSTSLEPLTRNTIVDRAALFRELEMIRIQGYAYSNGEWILEASGVAAPVFDRTGEVAAALTISGPTQRFTPDKVACYARQVIEVAGQISRDLGFYPQRKNPQPAPLSAL
jgi:DNA-binding IclR family transcriptional regulator